MWASSKPGHVTELRIASDCRQLKLEFVGITTMSRTQIRCGCLQQKRMTPASSFALIKSGFPSSLQYSSKLMPISAWMLERFPAKLNRGFPIVRE
jgi:hypothetical protein